MNATVTAAQPASTKSGRASLDWLAIIAFGLLWLEVVSRLRFEWSVNPQYGYGWTVPFLAAFIFWRRWQTAPAPGLVAAAVTGGRKSKTGDVLLLPPRRRQLQLLVILLSLGAALLIVPVRLIQEANPDWRILSWAMALAAVLVSLGGIYLAGGARWVRHFAFPILFFLVAVPWPTQFEQIVIQGLMRTVALINVEVLNLIGVSAVQMGNVIELHSGYVGIDDACTGVRSLQATFMVSLFLGEFYEFAWARRVILIIAGALLAFLCNLVRTFLLVYVGAERGIDAIKSWHDPAGLTILTACLFGLWGVSMFMSRKQKPSAKLASTANARRLPRLLLVSLLGLTIAAEVVTQSWYGYQEARAAKVQQWNVAWPEKAQNWKSIPVAEQAQELLRYNEGGGGTWSDESGRAWTMYFFKWLPGRTAGLFIKNHRPDICLPASGMTLQRGAENKLFEINGVRLPIRSYVFESGSTLLHVYYCYWDGSPPENAPQDQENWTAAGRLDAVRRGKREVGTQMLEIVAAGYNTDAEAEKAVREQLSNVIRRG
ncbi:MAG: exosortase/archaeosortase family protein [Verrucomicrobiota bacterium]|nr:exosortase/archaeosortase family protein [Verrucomicrobiota bacterium]